MSTPATERFIGYGAQVWHRGYCENTHADYRTPLGRRFCKRRGRWLFGGKVYCGTCIRERLKELA